MMSTELLGDTGLSLTRGAPGEGRTPLKRDRAEERAIVSWELLVLQRLVLGWVPGLRIKS